MLFLIVVVVALIIKEAFQGYKAEKYANKKVYGKDTDFLLYMFSNHPWIAIGIIVFVILAIIGTIMGE